MVQYYWNPNLQQPNFQNPNLQQQMMPPQVTIPSGRPSLPPGETSYIENILRLNIGEPGIFHFSFENTLEPGLNSRNIDGTVIAAGRDHVIVESKSDGHQFLFPMIYFDYAEFVGDVKYFPQTIQSRQV